jgi:hypothetical protein
MNRSPNSCGNAFRAPENHPRRSITEPRPLPSWSRLKNKTTLPPSSPSRRPSPPKALHRQPLPRKRPLRQRAMAPPLPRRKNRGASRPLCVRLCPAVEARPSTLLCEPAQSRPDPCQRPRVRARFSPDRGSPCRRRRRLRRIPHPVRRLRNRAHAPPRRPLNQLTWQRPVPRLEHQRRRCHFGLRPRGRTWPVNRPPVL